MRRSTIKLAEVAYQELLLAGGAYDRMAPADRRRVDRLWRGLRALDDEQASTLGYIEEKLKADIPNDEKLVIIEAACENHKATVAKARR
jgi:hypothetical protein